MIAGTCIVNDQISREAAVAREPGPKAERLQMQGNMIQKQGPISREAADARKHVPKTGPH